MNLFLDTSVILAACGSNTGASREIFRLREINHWTLITTSYVVDEVSRNLPKLPPAATIEWNELMPALALREDVLTLDRIKVFSPAKDRPILFSALAFSHVLLTLDTVDFGGLLGKNFYGLSVQKPGAFLEQERTSGRLNLLPTI